MQKHTVQPQMLLHQILHFLQLQSRHELKRVLQLDLLSQIPLKVFQRDDPVVVRIDLLEETPQLLLVFGVDLEDLQDWG